MPLIDFKEIPAGNRFGDEQDLFELFAKDLLEAMGFSVAEGPARGADRRTRRRGMHAACGTVRLRKQFEIPIQVPIGGKIIARETIYRPTART